MMFERNKSPRRAAVGAGMSVLLLLLAGIFPGAVLAEGNIQFGQGVPAVVETPAADIRTTGKAQPQAIRGERTEYGPGVNRVILAPVTPEESEQAIHARPLPKGLNQGVPSETGPGTPSSGEAMQPMMRIAGDTAPTGPASIAELARALKNDPDLIYEYVRNTIAYYPSWGLQKGAIGTLLDNQGTAFDQATLMVQLLRQAGFTANHVKGRINLTAAQVQDWLGVSTSNVCGVLNLFGAAQIPVASVTATAAGSCPGSTAALHSMKFDHVWVKVNIGGTNYYFDPSFKSHTHKTGINLTTASGYNASTYLTSAKSGATVTADYVQNINRTNIRNNLTTYSNSLATYLRTNLPAGTLDDVIGGKTIAPHTGGALRQASLPYQDTSVALTEWVNIPANYSPTLRIRYQGIDKTYTSDAIYGKRLTLTYNGSNQPVLMLDGAAQATGTAVTPGTVGTVTFDVTHGAYSSTFANQSFTQSIVAGGTFLMGNGWGPAGRGLIERYRSQLDTAKAAGSAATSEVVLGSSLAVLSATWIAQVNHADYITDRLAGTNTLFHHQIGIAGHNTAPYVDLPGNLVSVVSQSADAAKERAAFYSASMHSSIFESTAVQQTAGVSAVSTTKLIDIATINNYRIYNATSANYASAVQPNLVGCASWLATFQSQVSAGQRLILPARCDLTENSWSGTGYFTINSTGTGIGAIIGGGLAGGFSTLPQTAADTGNNILNNSVNPYGTLWQFVGKAFGDPIDMAKGHFLYAHEDIQTGAGEFPHGLGVQKLYSSGLRTQDGPLGKGWTHSLAASATVGSDGFQGMGEDSALDAVPTLVEKLVSLDLLADAAKPLDKMVVATLGQRWFGDQLISNTVIVRQGLNGEVFVKLPDGSHNPPPGNAARLTKHTDGTYRYETLNRALLAFNSAGKIVTYTHPNGVQAKFTYSGANLTQVANSLGRVLNFTYSGARISTVGDGTRSISYAFDTNGNLTSYTDATAKATTFQYDLPGRITKFFYPSNPSTAFATNVYDSLGRVQTQTNAAGKLYTYYFAGSRSEEVGPGPVSKVSYMDALGKVVKSVNPLGKITTSTYDGHGRLTRKVFPEGNALEYVYHDAPCAATDKRCTHNVSQVKQIAKPGSGLTTLTSSFTYETAFNKVASATDPRGKITTYTYTAQGNPLAVTSPADAAGVQPQTTFAYTAYTASGYPTFYLPTSQTSKITSGSTVVTTTTYNTTNKYVPQTVVVDSGSGKLNLTTTFTYDAVGNLTQINGPRTDVTDTTTQAFDAQRRVTTRTNALSKQTVLAYDADGRLIRSAAQTGTQWLVSCNTYTPTGKLLKAWGPAVTAAATTCPSAAAPVPVADYAYDNLDRLIRITENLTAGEGGNRITETVYNADDSVQIVKQAVGSSVARNYATYTYSNNGLPTTVKDARNNLTTYEYDGHDRRVKLRYPHPTTAGTSSTTDYEQMSLDANGNVTSLRKRNGQSITMAYDNLNRLLSRTYPTTADNITYTYDLLGRTTAANKTGYAISYVYDNAGRLTSTTAGGKTLAYQYDPAGNRTRLTWPETAFYVTSTYDALNRPTAIKETGTVNLATYAYDDLSRRTTVTLGNSTTTSYAYSTQSALATLTHNLTGTAQDQTYTYTRNQVQEITGQSWTNDSYQWTGYANGTKSYTANGLNQYTAAAGATLTHDTKGNLTGDGVWTYTYDLDNQLISANKTGSTNSLAYDGAGRLRQTTLAGTVTGLTYDGVDLVAEYNSGGTLLRRYVHGPGIDEPLVWYEGTTTTNKAWLYQDQLGSVIGTANSAGTSTAIHSYGPYGEPNIATGIRFRYTGQQFIGSLNLYYYKARFYSPALARFLQTDPIGTTDDLNLYAYVGNNPINFSDPSGLWGFAGAGWGALAGGTSGLITGLAQDDLRGGLIGMATGALAGAAVGFVAPQAAAGAGSRAAAAVTALAAGGANYAQQELTNNVYSQVDPQKVAPISGWNVAGAAVAGPVGVGTAKVIAAYGKEVTNATASIFGATLPAMVPRVTLGTKAADALYDGSMGAMMDFVATGLSSGSGGVTGLNGGSGGVVAPFTTFSQLLNLGK